jgi:hypothetical protein
LAFHSNQKSCIFPILFYNLAFDSCSFDPLKQADFVDYFGAFGVARAQHIPFIQIASAEGAAA